ncbi:MAG: Bifunctional xylanase/esterase [Stygiobacter sp.]|nr:MAG: Bifunctional xylanase/esterase [Stygiobacter sp.]KAF0217839.1 MAG: hypothetical protein FD178_373 [Ignavibacteria bacterium]
MLRNFLLVLIYFSMAYSLYSQQDKLKEVFPLEVGNSWTYGFNIGSSSMSHAFSNDSGTVKLFITGKTEFSNSIVWRFTQKRDYYKYTYNLPFSGWYKDSSNFELTEYKSGMHELFATPYDKDMVFPFIHTSTDSEKIFRYIDATTSNDLIKTRGKNNGYENDFFRLTFKVDTGIVRTTRSNHNTSSGNWARYNLIDFKKVHSEPFLVLPTENVNISVMSKSYKDTSITILNQGVQPLIISNVVSSNERFQVIEFSNIVQHDSEGKITIRFNPINAGITTATLTIFSNSYSSQNKISINGSAYDLAIIHLEPTEDIKFGGVPNGVTKAAAYTISNLGNIDLKIDSIKITHMAFSNKKKTMIISPGQTIIDTVYFSPLITSSYSANLKLYSNSKPTPYIMWLFGSSAEEIIVHQNYKAIYFGKIPVGQIRDNTVTIRNMGKESIRLVSTIIYNNINAKESSFIFKSSGTTIETDINPNSVYNQIIRFQPQNSNYISGSVINRYYSQNMSLTNEQSINIEGNLPDYLAQNYPNPFNGITKIRFQISSSSMVRLSIFDALGREIYTILNERLEPGLHEKIFSGNGLSSGVYFCRLQSDSYSETKKLILMK